MRVLGYGKEVPNDLSPMQIREVEEIMANAARHGGDGAITEGNRQVAARLAEIAEGRWAGLDIGD